MANAPQAQGLPYPQTQPARPASKSPLETADVTSEVSSISRRLRVLEERYTNLNKKMQVNEQNMLSADRELGRSFKALESEVLEVKSALEDLREKLKLVVLELKECAKQEEVAVLRKYVELWEVVNFATREEVARIVEEKLEGLRQKI